MERHSTTRFPYAGWPDDAVDLVERSIRTHGGWDAWKALEVIRIDPGWLKGSLPFLKGYGRTFGLPRRIELRPHRNVAVFEGYPNDETTGLYEKGTVSLVDAKTTETLIGSKGHRLTFDGGARRRRWAPLDALYFFGYALIHYHSIPYTLGEATFVSSRSVHVGGEELDVLELEFPPERETHSARQTFYFGREGLVRRHDYVAEVVGSWAKGSHFWLDYDLVDGLKFATRRQVRLRLTSRALPVVVLEAFFSRIEIESGTRVR
jgi:hypothetical protein